MKIARKIIGLDVDESTLKVAELIRKGRNRVVTNLASVALPPATMKDGRLEGASNFRQSLEALLLKDDFSANTVVFGLRSNWITIKTHRLPKMSKRELDKALEFEIPELVSFPVQSLRDVSFDYFINHETDEEVEIVLVACPMKFLNPYIQEIKATGLILQAIDLPALGWANLLSGEARRVFVEISEEQTTIQVALNGVFKVLRIVSVGANQIRQGVAEAFQCTEETAQRLCHDHDLDYLLMEGSGSKRVLRAVIQQFIGSVLQTLDFVRAQERATQFKTMLDELVLVGDLADLKGLKDMLAKELDLPVYTLKDLDLNLNIDFNNIKPPRFSCYGSALALALRGFA